MNQRIRNRSGCARAVIESLEQRRLLSGGVAADAAARPTVIRAHVGPAVLTPTPTPVGITPTQMRHAYGYDAIRFGQIVGDGTGQTIAIVDAYDDPNAAADLQSFDAAMGLPDPPSFTKLDENGNTTLPGTDPNNASWELEESLDIEWAHVMAPAANIILYEAYSAAPGDLIGHAANTARLNPGVTAVSMSFGSTELSAEASFDTDFTTPAGHAGVSFVAASGDNGAPGIYPAYSPNVLAVGGTTLSVDSAGNVQGETAWSGSGGGNSSFEPQPAYQNGVQSSGKRSIPDVAMDADPASGVPVYDSYDFGSTAPWVQVGGTSLAAPMWAGLVAIANQGRAIRGLSSLDGVTQLLPTVYQLPATDFNDITSGGNGTFSATAGYDLVTGRGSPVATALAAALAPAPSGSASFVAADTTTAGSWNGVYGGDGYSVIGGTTNYPSYAQVTPAGQLNWTWAASTTDTRGPQSAAAAASRVAACYYSGSRFSLDISLTDGQTHRVALYMVDWDHTSRVQTVTLADAVTGTALDGPRTVSNFHNGQWLVWNLSGHVKLTIANAANPNAVMSALCFGPPPLAPATQFQLADTSTSGNWGGVYGQDGYQVFNSTSALPTYATVTPSASTPYTWAASTTDTRAMQTTAGSSSRIAACLYSNTSFSLDVNLTDASVHRVALYLLDWDHTTRVQTVTVTNANTGTVLDTRSVGNFHNGVYLVWNLSGHVKLTITNTANPNAVASGILFGPAV